MGTELVIRIDLGEMLKEAPAGEPTVKEVVPPGYRCESCWRADGKHDTTCPHYGLMSRLSGLGADTADAADAAEGAEAAH